MGSHNKPIRQALEEVNRDVRNALSQVDADSKDHEQDRQTDAAYNAGATYEADRILKELPETLEVRKSRDCLMMNLEEAQKFFGITFKKPLFPWLSKIFA